MSCTQRKRKEKNITIRVSKQKLLKIKSRIRLSKKKKLWKINPIDKTFLHFEVMIESLR
jgi:UDP-3-O-acyl-N-acetylglucosamine deacetylase